MAASLPSIFLSLLLLVAVRITPALSAVPRSGALDHATYVPFDDGGGAGFAPRWYAEAIPAVPAQRLSPNPRHLLNGLAMRQVAGMCDPGFHSCVEANAPGKCCPNDRYCYLDENWAPQCCSLGVQCQGSLCKADELYCNTTSSTTIAVSTTTTNTGTGQAHGDVTTVTSIVSRTTFAACCNRACSTDAYSCEKVFGGQCCSYGFKCATSSECIADPAPATTTSMSTIVPEIPPGCTTSQITCAQSEGGGCCNTGSICTVQTIGAATSQVCAPDPGLADDGGSSGGLSSGAKAGIGVGVAVGAALVIAAVTWLCIRRRPRSGTTGTNMSENTGAVGGVRGDEDVGDSLLVGAPATPWTQRSAFTEGTDPLSPPLHEHGRAYSYHLPDAMAGPFTDRDDDGHIAPNPSLATTPPTGGFAGSMPYHPDDIGRPVASEAQNETGIGRGKGQLDEMPVHDQDTTVGRFELMGSLGTPSPPLNLDGEIHPTDTGPK